MSVATLDVPKVSGRHRNRAVAAQRRLKAVQMVAEGLSYRQVADELGYANKGTVHRLVREALAKQEQALVEDELARALVRLDQLLKAVWAKAMAGDVEAGKQAVDIIMRKARLLQLDKFDWAALRCTPRTVVVQDGDCGSEVCRVHGPRDALHAHRLGHRGD